MRVPAPKLGSQDCQSAVSESSDDAMFLWKGLSDKILCIHVRLFKSIVLFYFVNCVIISYQFLFTSSFIQNMSFLGFQKA